jgi:hypothetical protein
MIGAQPAPCPTKTTCFAGDKLGSNERPHMQSIYEHSLDIVVPEVRDETSFELIGCLLLSMISMAKAI